jgi:epsilon-lactone hydrolase
VIGRQRARGRLPAPALRPLVGLASRRVANERVPVERQRARMEAAAARAPLPTDVEIVEIVVGDVPCLRVAPRDADPTWCVLYLHGGGFCIGSPTTARLFAAHLALAAGVPVVVPDYRLAPEHPSPAALEDTEAVWRALADHQGPGNVVVAGDSAGGGLAVSLTQRLRDHRRCLPPALVLLSPWLDLAADRRADERLARRDPMLNPGWLEACAAAYAGGGSLARPELSPLRASLEGLPPTLVISGADDVLIADSDRFVRSAQDTEVEVDYVRVPGLWHVFPTQVGMLAEADRAVEQIAAFLERQRAAAHESARRDRASGA